MITRSRFSWFCVIVALAGTNARADDSLQKIIHELAQAKIDRGESVGIVVGIVHGGRHEVFAFGRPSLDDDSPPDGDTIFEIGSITKVFTSIALADLAREKKVGLDDPVAKLLPQGVSMPERNGKIITLRLLSTHRSGLPRVIPKVISNDLLGKQPYGDVTSKDMFDFLTKAKLNHDPGAHYAYSNLGAGLLGTVLALHEKTSYEELIARTISRPLNMRDTFISSDPTRELRLAKPYNSRGKPTIAWKWDSFAGAGALRSTANDMMRFIDANLGTVTVTDSLRATLDDAIRPLADTDVKHRKIALGWLIEDPSPNSKRGKHVWHNGGTGGFRSYLAFMREKKCGVIVLSNSDSSIDAIGLAAIEQLARE